MNVERVLAEFAPNGDPAEALVVADWCLERGDLPRAASALDRAWGLRPDDPAITRSRAEVLERLAVVEHGLVFRYIPAGTFLMGAEDGDPDERPVHPVRLEAYHVADIPMTWAAYCALMGWSAPPDGVPPDHQGFSQLRLRNKVRFGYSGPRRPMVATSAEDAEDLGAELSTAAVRYGLPSEAQWEKAARGGWIGAPYPWGHEAPTRARCDFGHFGEFSIRDPRELPPNGYGLYGMCGGISEWTADHYWAPAYRGGAPPGELPERVIRGGSWADSAYAVRVSFRGSLASASWRDRDRRARISPTVGFRLCRTTAAGG